MAEIKLPFVLTHEERHSPLWKKLNDHWLAKLETYHAMNEGDRTDTETVKLRGRIQELRINLALSREPFKE